MSNSLNKSLAALLENIVPAELERLKGISVSGLSLDARNVNAGDVFIAVQGSQQHGLSFWQQATDNNAVAIVYENTADANVIANDIPKDIVLVGVTNLRKHVSAIASSFYGHPSEDLTVVAITGTNGKTTCAYLLAQLLESQGRSTAIIGTLGSGTLDDLQDSSLTTPDAVSLQALLADFKSKGISHVVMEASSHALDQYRLDAVQVDVAAFTNLSQDHLDYHQTMDNYLAAKARLFAFASLKAAVFSADFLRGNELLEKVHKQVACYAYKLDPKLQTELCDLFADYCLRFEYFSYSDTARTMHLSSKNQNYVLQSPLLGEFNIANLLLCLQVMHALGCNINRIIPHVADLLPPPGRLQTVSTAEEMPQVVVDYAHTPDALEKALQSLEEVEYGELILVFGCGGDRDAAKRPIMGAVASQYADKLIVTDDNPRTENSEQIIEAIVSGIEDKKKVSIINDRAEAIKYAIQYAQDDDLVLIAGKGHENYQIIGDQKIDFSDYEYAKIVLDDLLARSDAA